MFASIRARILVWLLIVLFPVVTASVVATHIVDRDLSERVVTDLENVRRLEAARINQVLGTYDRYASSVASDRYVVAFTAGVHAFQSGTYDRDRWIGGYDGFEAVDPASATPLQQLVDVIHAKSRASAARGVEFRIVDVDGDSLGETAGFTWEPYDGSLVADVIETGEASFGNAFRNPTGDDLVGHVAPIMSIDGDVVGALEIEMELGPITDFLAQHERFGASSEAHIAQPTRNGDAELITMLRFERDAAFDKVVPGSTEQPVNASLDAAGGATLFAPDYRDVESILSVETIPATGWGLVVKIDQAEALAPLKRVQLVITAAGAAAAAAVLIGWAIFLRPLGLRLRRASSEAQNVLAGRHAPIDDRSRDEIGDVSRTIDRLAEDLEADRSVRAEYELELVRHATHDELTGLVNRQHATALVAELLADSADSASSLIFLDLDGFKTINDTYGHLIGDEVLIAVARRLEAVADDETLVARWGGDEFVVVLPGIDAAGAGAFVERARAQFDAEVGTSVGPQVVRWSVGTSTTEPGRTLDDLLFDADHRMFEEKQARKGRIAVSSANLREIETALVDHRIEVYYQPIIELHPTGAMRLWGAEALVRLRQVDGRIVTPAHFLEAAQDNHLGAAIDERVAEVAIEQFGRWRRDRLVDDDFMLTLNLCEASTRQTELAERLQRSLDQFSVEPGSIVLEISEETRHVGAEVLDRLHTLGVVVAVDDVGAGRSGVARLIDTAAKVGKIDGRWTTEVIAEPGRMSTPIVAGLDSLCRRLGMIVVVEGVETVEQRDLLLSLGIMRMQGFLFGHPMPASNFQMAWCEPAAIDTGREAARTSLTVPTRRTGRAGLQTA